MKIWVCFKFPLPWNPSAPLVSIQILYFYALKVESLLKFLSLTLELGCQPTIVAMMFGVVVLLVQWVVTLVTFGTCRSNVAHSIQRNG